MKCGKIEDYIALWVTEVWLKTSLMEVWDTRGLVIVHHETEDLHCENNMHFDPWRKRAGMRWVEAVVCQ